MRRRELIALAGAAALLGSAAGRAQPGRQPRIGILLPNDRRQFGGPDHPAILGLRDFGLIDGKTATILVRQAEGHLARLPDLARELVAFRPTVLVTAGPQAIEALRKATSTIPIVMAIVGDPVTEGFVKTLAHPGGNMTGLSMLNTELSGKRLELLKEAVPTATRVAAFFEPTTGRSGLSETVAAARPLGLELQVLTVASGDIAQGFAAAAQGRAQALLVMPSAFYNNSRVRPRLGALALQYRLPSMCEAVSYVRDGCLSSYGPDFAAMWRRSAYYVDKILKGAKPADLPVEQPTKFVLAVNLKTAKALALALPPILLAQAGEVVE